MGNLVSTTNQPNGRTFFSFLRRNSDELYWNAVASAFQVLNLETANEAARAPFRISYAENPAGTYTWTLNVGAFLDGAYTHTSQELIGVVEYQELFNKTVTIINGVGAPGTLAISVPYTPGVTLFSFLKRETDDLYYNVDNSDFELLNINSAPEAAREPFRIPFTENAGGNLSTYTWTDNIDVSGFVDGVYTIPIRELTGELETKALTDASVLITKGSVSDGLVVGQLGINHDTGGADNLKYHTAAGDPVSDAVIRVYTKVDWDAGNTDSVKGLTYTDVYGQWQSAVFVDVGTTYTVVFSKEGAYGPDTAEIAI